MSTLFKGVYYSLAIPVAEYTIQGSTLIKGAYYLRKYGMYFDAAVVFFTISSLLFRMAMAMLCSIMMSCPFLLEEVQIKSVFESDLL